MIAAILVLALVGTTVAAPNFAPVNVRSFLDDDASPLLPLNTRPLIRVVQRSHLADEAGQFTSSFQDTAGTSVSETGQLQSSNDGLDQVLVKQGSYSYQSPEGVPITITYTADARGFHPSGSNIPVVPTF